MTILDPFQKQRLQARENNIFSRLGIVRGPNNMVHQVDILEKLLNRIETLEKEVKRLK